MSTVTVEEVKRAASGRWLELLTNIGGLPAEVLDGAHHPCPKCGGTDRFRVVDPAAGAIYCNQCFSEKNGDGISAIQWATGRDFKAVVKMLTDHLGLENGNGHAPEKADFAKQVKALKVDPSERDKLLQTFCDAKPPIKVEALLQCDAQLRGWHGQNCIALAARNPIGAENPSAVILYRIDAIDFPAVGKLGVRKTHLLRGSKNAWLCSAKVTAATTILRVEGPSDLLAAVSAGLPDGWVCVTNTNGAQATGKLDFSFSAGKAVVIVGDADEPGQAGARKFASAFMKARAADVRLVALPYPVTKDHGKDLRDYFAEGHTMGELTALVEAAAPVTAEQAQAWAKPAGRVVAVGTDEGRVVDEAIDILSGRENVYQRGGSIVQIVEGAEPPRGIARPKDAPRIAVMRGARIREHLAEGAIWYRPTEDGKPEVLHPPQWVINAVEARGEWPKVKPLTAVVEVPVLRSDGSVLDQPGYDPTTGIVLRADLDFPRVPSRPTLADAKRARDALLEVVEDFPFAKSAHKAAWVAAVLTPLARYAFYGPAPLFLADANVRGSGKSLLVDVSSEISMGREAARMSLPHDDDEFRKRITALALAGEPLILLDNIPATLGGASLDAALTATSWSDRILGSSEMASNIPLFATWYATGNNVVLLADTARRTVHIRLESPEESPEERQGFHHPNLLGWVRKERPRLATAAVTILAAYWAAGRPNMKLIPWGSYEAWSDSVRSAVVWAGLDDPGSTRRELQSQSDREAAALRQLIAGWEELDPNSTGLTVAAVLEELTDNPTCHTGLRAALVELAPPKDGKTFNPRSVGIKLSHLRHRVVDGKCLDNREDSHHRSGAIWRVVSSDFLAGTAGTAGSIPAHTRAQAHTHAHAREETEAGENSTRRARSTRNTDPDCSHAEVDETPTHDGYVNRTCRQCGQALPCRRMEVSER